MSDAEIRELERLVRGGDPLARLELTCVAIRRNEGVLVVFGEKRDVPCVDAWLERRERHGKIVRWKAPAVVVLDLADLLAVTANPDRTVLFEIVDLASGQGLSGCYARKARVATVQLEPFARRKAGDASIKRRTLREPCAAERCQNKARSGLNGLCRIHFDREAAGKVVVRREVTT